MRDSFVRLLSVAIVLPNVLCVNALQANEKQEPVPLRNVELNADGLLCGRLIDSAGNAFSAVGISVTSGKQSLSLSTDATGRFAIAGLRGGVCTFRVNDSHYVCRVWANKTAPPKSIHSIALVVDEHSIVRGNRHSNRSCPGECDCNNNRICSSEAKYGLGILALGGTAAYFALSRDNASD